MRNNYRLCSLLSETLMLLRPFLRRAAKTARPVADAIRERKPCLLRLFLLEGWNVLFIILFVSRYKNVAKNGLQK